MKVSHGDKFNVTFSEGEQIHRINMGLTFVDVLALLIDFAILAGNLQVLITQEEDDCHKAYMFMDGDVLHRLNIHRQD